jgi:uncharacterized RDD family membrane protein YckC
MTDQLVSGEGVAYELSHAGIGSRIVAALIDLVVQFVALIVLFTVLASVGGGDSAAVVAISLVTVVLVLAGYPIVSEWLTRGRTLGKVWMGLRVVRDDGGPIGFRQALVRGLAGLVLEKPGLFAPLGTLVGFATVLFSSAQKRVGDMMAGTFVLNERAGTRRSIAATDFYVPPELQPWAAALDLSRLDDQLALSVRQFVVRAPQLTSAAQHALGEQLRARVAAVIAPPPPPWAPTPLVLIAVLGERRRRSEAARTPLAQPGGWTGPGPSAPPPAPPTPPSAPPPASASAPTPPPQSPFAPPS